MSEELGTKFTVEDVVSIYYGNYDWYAKDREDIREQLKGADVVYAVYETGSYEGAWCVVYIKDGKWFVDSGGHCSCNGPEWGPVETTPEKLLDKGTPTYLFPEEEDKRFRACINSRLHQK